VLDGVYISISIRLYNTTVWIPLILKVVICAFDQVHDTGRHIHVYGMICARGTCVGICGLWSWLLQRHLLCGTSRFITYFCKLKCHTKREVIIINTQTIKILPLINHILVMTLLCHIPECTYLNHTRDHYYRSCRKVYAYPPRTAEDIPPVKCCIIILIQTFIWNAVRSSCIFVSI
jgi:hypothetical protein